MKLLGAMLMICGCSGVAFAMCSNYRRAEKALEQLIRSLEWMSLELNYRMPPLASLCASVSQITDGAVSSVFEAFSKELQQQITPDVSVCMDAAIQAVPRLPPAAIPHFKNLGIRLGRFDLQGQIAELEAAAAVCREDHSKMSRNRELRLRNYQTLGICAGIALAILFL